MGILTQATDDESYDVCQDYILPDGGGAWIKVGDKSLWIRDMGDSVRIEAYNDGHEADENPIDALDVDYGG